jgi:uncharacterized protein (DUF736 family)
MIALGGTFKAHESRDEIGIQLDDPSFNAPICANLFDEEDGNGYTRARVHANSRLM